MFDLYLCLFWLIKKAGEMLDRMMTGCAQEGVRVVSLPSITYLGADCIRPISQAKKRV